jgi:deferrochelatase/peroxidase EfeB
MFEHIRGKEIPDYEDFPMFLDPEWKLAHQLLSKKWSDMTEVLEVVFRVCVEKLSYAAQHCSSHSHVRRLNNGEFITVVWLLTTWLFHGHYSHDNLYRLRAAEFFMTRRSTQYKDEKKEKEVYPTFMVEQI